jgi:hypothetical protein
MNRIIPFSKGIFILIILTHLIPHHGFSQHQKGQVKSFRESFYTVHDDFGLIHKSKKLEDPLYHDRLVSFDPNGNVTQEIEYNPDGTIQCTFAARSDYEDNNVETFFPHFYPEPYWESKPYIIEQVRYSLGKVFDLAYTNDSIGRPAEEIMTDLMGNVVYRVTMIRNSSGSPVEERFSDGTTYFFIYSEDGRRKAWVIGCKGDTTKFTYTYDNHGNISSSTVDNFYQSRYKYHYDTYFYQYKYDKHWNWIERIEYFNGTPERIAVRKIEYYK